MHKLNDKVMRSNQDPDEHYTEVIGERDELNHIDESFTASHILDLIQEGLIDEYEPARFTAKRDPEVSMKKIENAMRNMYANRVSHGEASTLSRGKGLE